MSLNVRIPTRSFLNEDAEAFIRAQKSRGSHSQALLLTFSLCFSRKRHHPREKIFDVIPVHINNIITPRKVNERVRQIESRGELFTTSISSYSFSEKKILTCLCVSCTQSMNSAKASHEKNNFRRDKFMVTFSNFLKISFCLGNGNLRSNLYYKIHSTK